MAKYTLADFGQQFPDDATCLAYLWRAQTEERMSENNESTRYEAVLDALAEEAREVTEVRAAARAFRLEILTALGVTDRWAIATWRTVDYVRAIERLRLLTQPENKP